jgi:uncharacterized protein
MRILLLSLHDVTPRHAARLALAEPLFRDLGVTRVTYLLVPRYHGGWAIDDDRGFSQWCLAPRPFAVRWCLHGYLHQETGPRRSDPSPIRAWLKRRLLTAGEGEFLSLSDADAGDRIDRGRRSHRACLGADPDGFVAPAWLFNDSLIPALAARDFAWTEDHRHLYDLRNRKIIGTPVITWASRSRARRWGSIWMSSWLERHWHGAAILRVAVHPCDFDHPSIVREISRTLVAAMRDRTLDTYDNLLRTRPEGGSM